MKYNIFLNWLYKLLVIYVFFNEILTKSIFEGLTSLKYLIFLYLVFYLINKKNKVKFSLFGKEFIFLYFYILLIVIITLPSFLSVGLAGLGSLKNLLFLPFAIYLFSFYEKITGKSFQSLLTFIVQVAVAHVVINTFLYFYELPIWKSFHPYWGRISQGYPTIDVVVLSFSLAICLMYSRLELKFGIRVLFSFILVVGNILLASGTGVVMIVFIFLWSILIPLFQKNGKKKIKAPLMTFIIVGLSFSAASQIIKHVDESLYESMYLSLQNRIAILTGSHSELDVDTMDVRDQRRRGIKRFQTTFGEKIFGTGFAHIEMNPKNERLVGSTIFLEDQYSINMLTIGYVGNLLFYIVFLLSALDCYRKSEYLKAELICLFIISSFTSGCFINYSISVFTGLFLCPLFKNASTLKIIRKQNEDTNNSCSDL